MAGERWPNFPRLGALKASLMDKWLCGLTRWLHGLVRGCKPSRRLAERHGSQQASATSPLTGVHQAVHNALPLLEQQLSGMRMMDELLVGIEDQLARAWREREGLIEDYYAVVQGVLRVLDDCQTMRDKTPELQVIKAELERILRHQRVEMITVAIGDHFQPDLACCEQTEASDEHAPGTVLRVLESGYQRRLDDGNTVVIRPARVAVSQSQATLKESHQ